MGVNFGGVMVFVLLCFLTSQCQSWKWFSSSSSSSESSDGGAYSGSDAVGTAVAEFSMKEVSFRKGVQALERANEKSLKKGSCWQDAYGDVHATCSEIGNDEEKRARFAWKLSDCFQKDGGRRRLPKCDSESLMVDCIRDLDDLTHTIYLEFYLEANALCHQIQSQKFNRETAGLIIELKNEGHGVKSILSSVSDTSQNILQSSKYIQGSVESINVGIEQMEASVGIVANRTEELMRKSESILEQGERIAESQTQLAGAQVEMERRVREGMEALKESQENLGEGMEKIREDSVKIQKEINEVGKTVSGELQSLHSKTESITELATSSLNNQQLLIQTQDKALHHLHSLSHSQSKAFQETRLRIQEINDLGKSQHQELIQRQEQVQQFNDRLMANAKSILSAQETFESKQANMFSILNKIFSLQNAMFLESRMLKSFIIYVAAIFVIYMLTSTKNAESTRPVLYIGLCVLLLLEIGIVRFSGGVEEADSFIDIIRYSFALFASAYFVYSILNYRDYAVLNYHMLQNLNEKVGNLERTQKEYVKLLHYYYDGEEEDDDDDDVDWERFIVSDILPEEINLLEDPDFEVGEEAVNSITEASRKCYNLRSRRIS